MVRFLQLSRKSVRGELLPLQFQQVCWRHRQRQSNGSGQVSRPQFGAVFGFAFSVPAQHVFFVPLPICFRGFGSFSFARPVPLCVKPPRFVAHGKPPRSRLRLSARLALALVAVELGKCFHFTAPRACFCGFLHHG